MMASIVRQKARSKLAVQHLPGKEEGSKVIGSSLAQERATSVSVAVCSCLIVKAVHDCVGTTEKQGVLTQACVTEP